MASTHVTCIRTAQGECCPWVRYSMAVGRRGWRTGWLMGGGRFMATTDRRVRRTRERLQHALLELVGERGYDAITVQDIADRADVGRTTFYLHYRSNDDLLIGCHEAIISKFPVHPLSREALQSPEAPPGMASAYRHLEDARALLYPIFQGYVKDGPVILRRIRESIAQRIETCLRAAFPEAGSTIPLDMLANCLAGAQLALIQWWLEKRRPCAAEDLAQAFHRLQRGAIREALGTKDGG